MRTLVLSCFLFTISFSLQAQQKLENQPLQFRVWTGYSFSSIYFLGKTRSAASLITGLGIRRAIRQYSGKALLYYTADVIPYLYFEYPKRDENDRFVERKGFGVSPVGFIFEKRINQTFSYQIGVSGSFIIMETEFPTDKSRKLNFTFDPSFTIQTHISNAVSFATGYKFHHISNAQTGNENPGLDSNFIFFTVIIK